MVLVNIELFTLFVMSLSMYLNVFLEYIDMWLLALFSWGQNFWPNKKITIANLSASSEMEHEGNLSF